MNPLDMLKNLQKLQSEMAGLQEQLKNLSVEGRAGGDLVVARVNGQLELVDLRIDPAAVDPQDRRFLEDLVRTAVNDGLHKARDLAKDEMGRRAGGLDPSQWFGGPR